MNLDTETMYNAVTTEFHGRVHAMFESEDSLKATWEKHFAKLPFDRTSHWNTILVHELSECWRKMGPAVKAMMTTYDRDVILQKLSGLLDFNLFSQVFLNLQSTQLIQYGMAGNQIEDLKSKWAGKSPSPFDPKPKMFKTAATQEEKDFNQDLSRVRAIKIIADNYGLSTSFRVSPKGSTPALTDSRNLSMLGSGADGYLTLPVGYNAVYFTWDTPPDLLRPLDAANTFEVTGIAYEFQSKSGGDMLSTALFARLMTMIIFQMMPLDCYFALLPRVGSLLLVSNVPGDAVKELVKERFQSFPANWNVVTYFNRREF